MTTVKESSLFRFRPELELAVFCLMVMELCWLTPWYRSLTPATYATPSGRVFLVFGGILLTLYSAARLMNFARLRIALRRWISIGLFGVCILLSLKLLLYPHEILSLGELLHRPLRAFNDVTSLLPDEFVLSLAVLGVGWRGLALARQIIEPVTVLGNFRLGIVMFLGFVFINTLVTGEVPGAFIYLFLFCALMAMGAARISTIGTLRGGGRTPFDRRWLVGMIVASLLVVGFAALLAYLASAKGVFQQIGTLIFGLFALLSLAIISPALYFLPSLAERFPAISTSIGKVIETVRDWRNGLMDAVSGIAEQISGLMQKIGVSEWGPSLKPFLLWSIVAGIGALIILSLSRWMRKEQEGRRSETQSLFPAGELFRLLKAALQNKLRAMGGGLVNAARLRQAQRLRAAARIRRIYAELMDLAEDFGSPRPSALTPLEFLSPLKKVFPLFEAELTDITHAYLRVRYGELPETRQEVNEVEAAWERVRAEGKERLTPKKH